MRVNIESIFKEIKLICDTVIEEREGKAILTKLLLIIFASFAVYGFTMGIYNSIWQAVASAIKLVPARKVILSDAGNFPSDLYMVEGLISLLGQGYSLKTVAPEDVADAIDETVAVVMLTQVDYRTGRMHDMNALTARAHQAGAAMVWDLAHSAGAIPVDIKASGAEFAVGCTYKYLNAGPGAPAFIYVRPDLAETVQPALSGWLGHRAPFDFAERYAPGLGIERMRVGTPPVLQMAFQHEPHDRAIAGADLFQDVACHDRLAGVILAGVGMAAVHHDGGGQAGYGQCRV